MPRGRSVDNEPGGPSAINIICPFDLKRLNKVGNGFIKPEPGEGWRMHLTCKTCGREYFLSMKSRRK
jgi:hypothetical protein